MRDTVVLIAAAAVVIGAGLYLSRRNGGGILPGLSVSRSGSPDSIINNALPGDPGWAWQYFPDGVAIGPDGKYYKHGSLVWSPD